MSTLPDSVSDPLPDSLPASPRAPAPEPALSLTWTHGLLLAIGILASAVFLFHYGAKPLAAWDEATYAEIAKQMLLRHDWLDQWVNGVPFMDKPPMMTWLIALSYSLFGMSELSTRLPSALFGGASLVLTVLIARQLYGWRVAAFAAGILPLMELFLDRMALGDLDAPLLAFTLAALYAYLRAGMRMNVWVGVSVGLAVMTKNAGGLLPLLIIGMFNLFVREKPAIRPTRGFWHAAGAALAIVAPWHLFMTWKRGLSFWESYAFYHVFERSTRTIENQASDPWYYLNFLREDLKVLLPLVLLGASWLVWESLKPTREGENNRFVITWFVVPFALYNYVHTKLFWYVLPCYPALAIAAAQAVEQFLVAAKQWSGGSLVARFLLATATAGSIALLVRSQPQQALYWWFEPHDGVREVVGVANDRLTPDETLYVWVPNGSVNDPGWYRSHIDPHVTTVFNPDFLYYRHGKLKYLATHEERAAFLASGHGMLVGYHDDINHLPHAASKPLVTAATYYRMITY